MKFEENKKIVEFIEAEIEKLHKSADEIIRRDPDRKDENTVPAPGDEEKRIAKGEDEEKYKLLREFYNFVTSDKSKDSENPAYIIPGIEIGGEKIKMGINKKDLEGLALIAPFLERKFDGLKFTDQVYQFHPTKAGLRVHGTTLEFPRPRLYEETLDEYEKYLEEYYAPEGIEKEIDTTTGIRVAYNHELVDLRKGTEPDPAYRTASYNDMVVEESKKKLGGGASGKKRNKKMDADDEIEVIDGSDKKINIPLGEKLGAAGVTISEFFKNESNAKKIKVAIVGIAAGAVLIAVLGSMSVAAKIGLGVAGGAAFLGGVVIPAVIRKFRKKSKDTPIKDFFFGKKVKKGGEGPEKGKGKTKGPEEGPSRGRTPGADGGSGRGPSGDGDTPPSTEIDGEFVNLIETLLVAAGTNLNTYRQNQRKIMALEERLAELTDDSLGTKDLEAIAEVTTELEELRAQKATLLENMGKIADNFQNNMTVTSGGRSL